MSGSGCPRMGTGVLFWAPHTQVEELGVGLLFWAILGNSQDAHPHEIVAFWKAGDEGLKWLHF
jgi:hypothetical protein